MRRRTGVTKQIQQASAAAVASVVTVMLAMAQSPEPSGARSMFYNPSTGTVRSTPGVAPAAPPPPPATAAAKPAPVRFVGIHYWLDLEGVGPVADTRTFVTGERIRLNVRSNSDGYLAIWTLTSAGKARLLVPADSRATAVALRQSTPFVSAPIRFSDPAGDERLLMFFARQKAALPSLETMDHQDARAALFGTGGRDLLVEVEEAKPGDVGTFVVNRVGGPVSRAVLLRHKSAER